MELFLTTKREFFLTTEYTEKAREEHGTLMGAFLWLKLHAPRLASDFLPLASSYVYSVVEIVSPLCSVVKKAPTVVEASN